MRKLALLTFAMAACAPGPYYPSGGGYSAPAASSEPAAEPAAAAQPDTRNAGQVVVDIMAQSGYTCTALDSSWECTVPNSTWQLYVSYVDSDDGSTTTIWFDSYLERAFAQPCSTFDLAVHDLADTSGAFQASCQDDGRKFRLNTAVTYGADLHVMAWVKDHETRRVKAGRDLRSIHALSRDSARIVSQR